MTTITKATKAAISRYSYAVCIEAFRSHDRDGEGAATIALGLGLTTRQADAAINAGREIQNILKPPAARQVAAWAKANGLRKQPGTLNGLIYFRAATGALLTVGAVRDLMIGA